MCPVDERGARSCFFSLAHGHVAVEAACIVVFLSQGRNACVKERVCVLTLCMYLLAVRIRALYE